MLLGAQIAERVGTRCPHEGRALRGTAASDAPTARTGDEGGSEAQLGRSASLLRDAPANPENRFGANFPQTAAKSEMFRRILTAAPGLLVPAAEKRTPSSLPLKTPPQLLGVEEHRLTPAKTGTRKKQKKHDLLEVYGTRLQSRVGVNSHGEVAVQRETHPAACLSVPLP